MAIDFKALGAAAAKSGTDMTQAKQGGGDYTPPAEGNCRLRLVGYIELGKHSKVYKGVPKTEAQVELVFEVSGPKHPPADVDGKKVPIRLSETMSLSLNEKANFFKLFQRMNYAGDAQHMIQLLGRPFLGTIFHDKWTGKDGKERVTAQLRGPDGYSIRPPRVEDPESGEWKVVEVAPAITPLKGFLWDHADLEQWDSIFIDGEYPARTNDKGEVTAPAKSKNVFQEKIRSALNFPGSPIAELLATRGIGKLDLPATDDPQERPEDPPATQAPTAAEKGATAAADPLAGVA
jgi:hypothetical protein